MFPDLYNHSPLRKVSQKEAASRGWPYFFWEKKCIEGHVAPRFTSNSRMCVDCNRISKGKPPLTPLGSTKPPRAAKATPKKHPYKDQIVDETDQKFLEAYAELRDVEGAAKAVGLTVGQVEARIASDKIFREAAERLGLRITQKAQTTFEWTDAKRDQLLEVWVDTGDIASARDAISVTPSEYLREIARNPAFAKRVEETEPLAELMLVERAYQLALGGNDKLLNKILPAVDPNRFSERVKLDVTTKDVSDAQLEAKFFALLGKVRRPLTIDAEVIDVEAVPVLPAPERA